MGIIRMYMEHWHARSVPPVFIHIMLKRAAGQCVTLVNTLCILLVLNVHWEPTRRQVLQKPARLVLLGHSLITLDHHRVRYVLWGHTLAKVKAIAHSAPKGHTTLQPERHRA